MSFEVFYTPTSPTTQPPNLQGKHFPSIFITILHSNLSWIWFKPASNRQPVREVNTSQHRTRHFSRVSTFPSYTHFPAKVWVCYVPPTWWCCVFLFLSVDISVCWVTLLTVWVSDVVAAFGCIFYTQNRKGRWWRKMKRMMTQVRVEFLRVFVPFITFD